MTVESAGGGSATTGRYTKRWISLPDGRLVYGRLPGTSSVTLLEHVLRDELARRLSGVTEAVLPYGRADVLTEQAAIEVEPASHWRTGVRQALSYAAQAGLPPHLALFGAASPERVLSIYLKLRDGRPAIHLWWYGPVSWVSITSRNACRKMPDPAPRPLVRGVQV